MDKYDDLDTTFIRYNFDEFVCWTIWMLYETKPQSVGELAYLYPASIAFRSIGDGVH